ncbi:dual specificity phosphatase 29-like [Sycon ciliatum]|uniref:dual specificity phosphatase 29-like n=1 Tax=Sycon ciliatum TaxID=27933 RepID=UPI0020ACF69B|eukprot:scpid29000/ scgid35466/ Dual specificity protein phosphatase 1
MTSSPVVATSTDRRVCYGRRPSQLLLNVTTQQNNKMAESAKSQIHFSGNSSCPKFTPNQFKPSICSSCSSLVSNHKAEAVDDSVVQTALEHLVDSVPSLVLDRLNDVGPVYLGGYKAAANTKFLTEEANISHVVCTAQGLGDIFGPRYIRSIDAAKEKGVTFLDMDWLDRPDQNVTMSELAQVIRFVEKGRTEGTGVLIHCAQGKSRSGMATMAYVMAKLVKNVDDSLALVRSRRTMAEPNFGFMIALTEFEQSPELALLREEIGTQQPAAASPPTPDNN